MRRLVVILTLTALLLAGATDIDAARPRKRTKSKTQARSIEMVKKEKESTSRAIRETGRKITDNRRLTERQLDSLESIRRDAAGIRDRISSISSEVNKADQRISLINDSIATLTRRQERLRASYTAMLRKMQGERAGSSRLSFVLSAPTFRQAWQRMRYVRQFGEWQKTRTAELRENSNALTERRRELEQLRSERAMQVSKLNDNHRILEQKQSQSEQLLAELRKRGSDLQTVLREKEQKARELDKELDRLIAAEQARIERQRREQQRREQQRLEARRKKQREDKQRSTAGSSGNSGQADRSDESEEPTMAKADRKLSGSFSSNKGRLLFPVAGSYRIVRGYGRQRHPDMPHVTTENNGIDIEVRRGVNARAVFDGRVASILQMPGYNYIVMIRHGDYLTVYSGLDKPLVHNGQEVKANQTLAPVTASPDREGYGVLHFELRYNSRKCNPSEWVR